MASHPARWGPARAPVEDPEFRAIKAAVVERTGHFYYDDKDDLLWERIGRRLRATGLSGPQAYLARLMDERLGEAEWQALETEITIGETFFFRYVEQFDAIRRTILPEAIARNRERRQLRIWSAGSSNGSEAYTLAIVLHEVMAAELGRQAQDWRVSVLGTDINEQVLASAREARFGAWAVRSLGAAERARYFLPAAPSGPWIVRPEYRGLVHFERHNLMSLVAGTSPLQFTDFDLILCRNVLIYFHPDVVPAMVRGLGASLAPGGWLLLGHAEPNIAFGEFLQAVELPGTVAYRRPSGEEAEGSPEPDDEAVAREPLSDLPVRPRRRLLPRAPANDTQVGKSRTPARLPAQAPAHRMAGREIAGQAPDKPDVLARARALADAGDVASALDLVRSAGANPSLDPALPFLEGLLTAADGRPGEAMPHLERAVYLDRRFVMAHYHLGLVLMAGGDLRRGRRVIAHAARLAALEPDDADLPWGDGLTAGGLVALTRAMLAGNEPAGADTPADGLAAHEPAGQGG